MNMQDFTLEGFLLSGGICSLNDDEVIIGWGQKAWKETAESYPIFYAPDFFLEEKKRYLHFPHFKKIKTDQLLALFPKKLPLQISFSAPNWDAFEDFFNQFQDSDLVKAVPYVQKLAQVHFNQDVIESLLAASLLYQKNHPATTLYGFWDDSDGVIGVTPELLFSKSPDKALKSVACAGTASIEQADKMLGCPKLKWEHDIVIEGVKQSLTPFGSVRVAKTEIKRFAKIAHLMTSIEVDNCLEIVLDELVGKVHPTAALGTFPKEEGAQFLKKYAIKIPRKRFGAPFGILERHDSFQIYVAIRNLQWDRSQMMLTAGCGIVKESILQMEKQEIINKISAIKNIFNIN